MTKEIQFKQSASVASIPAEIVNMNEKIRFAYYNIDVADDYIFSLGFDDLEYLSDVEEIREQMAKMDYQNDHDEPLNEDADDYDEKLDSARELLWGDGASQLLRISRSSNLYQWLLDWYGRGEFGFDFAHKNMEKHVRYFIENDDAIYFMTGVGYDTLDADLLGGNADGSHSKAFYAFFDEHTDGSQAIKTQKIRAKLLGQADVIIDL